ncbi:hypothetical protein HK405_007636 [Cladochytrium tenue]|nr:hypothetical protein HK405_007636 [Cladochytrium tenue]
MATAFGAASEPTAQPDTAAAAAAEQLICSTCGTQYPETDRSKRTTCFICDDPRQYVPGTGQAFTTMRELLQSDRRNVFTTYTHDDRVTFIHTEPQFAINQRAALIRTPAGNILWDCVALLDDDTVSRIKKLGGIDAIVISHPHYYTTHLLWAREFGCRVYLAEEDEGWLAQRDEDKQVLLQAGKTSFDVLGVLGSKGGEVPWRAEHALGIKGGATVLKLGGHFPGSLVLLFDGRLFVADTLYTTPAGRGNWIKDAAGNLRDGHLGRPEGMNTFAFMWSIPNMVPLSGEDIGRMWKVLVDYEFRSTHGAFLPQDIEDAKGIKFRVAESMHKQVYNQVGYSEFPFLAELEKWMDENGGYYAP